MHLRLALASALLLESLTAQTLEEARTTFQDPPPNARIMMRWWWFGSAVTNAELEAEMRAMQFMGIGGFEIQPVYPLALDEPKGLKNLPYLSEGYLAALKFTAEKGRELDLRVNITLGSGWPFGGPHVPVTEAAGRLRVDRLLISGGAKSVPMPEIVTGEKLLAIFAAKGELKKFNAGGLRRLTPPAVGTRLDVPADSQIILFFIASRTGQQVKRPAVGAEGFVLDHYSRSAIEHHLKVVGEPLLKAFGPNPPYSIFSDSLEVYNSDWTDDLLVEFKMRRGYDLAEALPALDAGFEGEIGGRGAEEIRHDWGITLSELCDERYMIPIRDWAKIPWHAFSFANLWDPAGDAIKQRPC